MDWLGSMSHTEEDIAFNAANLNTMIPVGWNEQFICILKKNQSRFSLGKYKFKNSTYYSGQVYLPLLQRD